MKIEVDCACTVCEDEEYNADDIPGQVLKFLKEGNLYGIERFSMTFFGWDNVLMNEFFETYIDVSRSLIIFKIIDLQKFYGPK